MEIYTQVAALPYVFLKDEPWVCLITTRETKRLVIPKGWPKLDVPFHEMAAIEAKEEAGLIGTIDKKPIGTYNYKKRLHIFAKIACEVKIFPFKSSISSLIFQKKVKETFIGYRLKKRLKMLQKETSHHCYYL